MEQTTTIGLDIARKRLTRTKLLGFFATHAPCIVAMEACAGSHHWARDKFVKTDFGKGIVSRCTSRTNRNYVREHRTACFLFASHRVCGHVGRKSEAHSAISAAAGTPIAFPPT